MARSTASTTARRLRTVIYSLLRCGPVGDTAAPGRCRGVVRRSCRRGIRAEPHTPWFQRRGRGLPRREAELASWPGTAAASRYGRSRTYGCANCSTLQATGGSGGGSPLALVRLSGENDVPLAAGNARGLVRCGVQLVTPRRRLAIQRKHGLYRLDKVSRLTALRRPPRPALAIGCILACSRATEVAESARKRFVTSVTPPTANRCGFEAHMWSIVQPTDQLLTSIGIKALTWRLKKPSDRPKERSDTVTKNVRTATFRATARTTREGQHMKTVGFLPPSSPAD